MRDMKSLIRTDERILASDIFGRDTKHAARPDHGRWQEPGRSIPVYHLSLIHI